MPKKKVTKTKKASSKDIKKYNELFETLKDEYVNKCKEFSTIQDQLNKVDMERDQIMSKINELQTEYSSIVDNEVVITLNEITTSSDNVKNTNKLNLIDRYKKKKINKSMIKKPSDNADSDSESNISNSSDSDNSDIDI
tara:strand:+ start:131 stop:547 length:417 start_codon:yes stop_codon:yes gene_type:complete